MTDYGCPFAHNSRPGESSQPSKSKLQHLSTERREVSTDQPSLNPDHLFKIARSCLVMKRSDGSGGRMLYLDATNMYTTSHDWDAESKAVYHVEAFGVKLPDSVVIHHPDFLPLGVDVKEAKNYVIELDCKLGSAFRKHPLGFMIQFPYIQALSKWPRSPAGFSTIEWEKIVGKRYTLVTTFPKMKFNIGRLTTHEGNPCGDATSEFGNCSGPWVLENGQVIGLHIGGWISSSLNSCVRLNSPKGSQ